MPGIDGQRGEHGMHALEKEAPQVVAFLRVQLLVGANADACSP
jgi:hypothetical protein